MTYLITGTAGFIGSHLALKLLERGDTVVGIDSINDYYSVQLKLDRLALAGIPTDHIAYAKAIQSETYPAYTFYQMQLQDRPAIEQLFAQYTFDGVVNLAAQAGVRYSLVNPHAYIDSNINGFVNLLEGCRHQQVKHLVYASSSSVYGLNTTMPFSVADSVDHPVSLYAATKKSNELMAHAYSHLYGLPTTGLRFFTVYGPWGRPDMALFLFTDAILRGEPVKLFNKGNMRRDFTYIDDIIEGMTAVMDRPAMPDPDWDGTQPTPGSSTAPARIYNIGAGSPVELMDFVRAIEDRLGKVAQYELMPMQPGDVYATFADTTALTRDTGYQPQTEVTEGINRFVDWYLDYYEKKT